MNLASSDSSVAFDAYQNRRHFGSLDGLRFFCIALVLWLHSPAYAHGGDFARFLTRGHTGVDFFFVLSGFLITTLLLREEARVGRISLKGFYWRRALRILPAYLLLVLALSVYYILVKGQTEYLAKIPYYLFFVANMLKEDIPLLSIAWSLAVEEQFYLLWPLTLVLLAGFKPLRVWLLSGLIIYCLLGGAGLYRSLGFAPIETEQALWAVHFRGFSAILIGALLALLLNTPQGFSTLWKIAGHRASPLIGAVVLVTLFQFLPKILTGWPYGLLHLTMAFILASIVMREDHMARGFMGVAPIRRVGQISYGIYLYHLIGLHISSVLAASLLGLTHVSGPWIITGGMIVAALIISELSFRFYEQPFLNLRHRKK